MVKHLRTKHLLHDPSKFSGVPYQSNCVAKDGKMNTTVNPKHNAPDAQFAMRQVQLLEGKRYTAKVQRANKKEPRTLQAFCTYAMHSACETNI
jgi:hypothetical protein